MRKLLFIFFTIALAISCTSDKKGTLFGKYTYEDENEKMTVTLNSDSTGILITDFFGIGNDTRYFVWSVENGKISIKDTQSGKKETTEFTFDGEYFTVNNTRFKKE